MELNNLKKLISNVKLSVENFWSKLNITSSDIIRFVSCFGIGFLIGLFLKRYIKYFILFLLCAVLLLAVLQYFNIININYEQIKLLLGFSKTATIESIIQTVLVDIREHSIAIACGILGCLLGFKLG